MSASIAKIILRIIQQTVEKRCPTEVWGSSLAQSTDITQSWGKAHSPLHSAAQPCRSNAFPSLASNQERVSPL
jgi:hypothetical protein